VSAAFDPAPDLAIVGAGPAGMAAATQAVACGLSVTVLDQNPAPGGQVYRAAEAPLGRAGGAAGLLGADYAKGGALVATFRASGATYLPGAAVHDLGRDGTLGYVDAEGAAVLRPARVLIAAGAMERPVPFPGWTLPGVMTAGAAQTLLKSSGLVPGDPVVIAGSGPLIYLVTAQLLEAGVQIAALVETAGNWRAALPHLPAAALAGPELWQGLRWLRRIARARLPRYRAARLIRAEGDGRLEAVEIEASGRRHRLPCALLLVHEGVVPSTQLAQAAGCTQAWDEARAAWATVTDRMGRTSQPHILAAGDGTGVRGARAARHAGTLAALAAARDLGKIGSAELSRRAAPHRRALAGIERVRPFLDALYRPREEVLAPPDDETIVCRCEEVTAGEIRAIARMGVQGPNQAKTFCRAGMGPCQGRMCGGTVAALIAAESGRSMAGIGHLRIRPPVKPITIGEMAALRGLPTAASLAPGMPTGPEER